MRRAKYFTATLLFCCLLFPVSAQLRIDAQVRPRFEIRDGYQKLAGRGSVPGVFISQRTRLSFIYNTEKLKLTISPQDVRVWGDEQQAISTGVFGDYASLDLYEGYAEIRLGKSGWLSVGRQPISYDGERIFALRDWNQNGLTYDALVLKLDPGKWNLHFGTSWNSTGEINEDDFYPSSRIKTMNYIWLNRDFSDILKLSLFHLATGRTVGSNVNILKFRQTSGIYAEAKYSAIGIVSNLYYQYGKNIAGMPVSALLFDGEINFTTGNLIMGAAYSYLSGNDKTGSLMTTDHLFDVYYGSRLRYFGSIAYFRDMVTDTKEGGMEGSSLYFDLTLNKHIILRNTSRYLKLAQINQETPADKNLGFENDLKFEFQFSEWGLLEAGHYFFLPTKSLKTLQNVPQARFSQFIFLQLTLSPTLFGI